MPRKIEEILAELPPGQQREVERRYQALLRTLPNPQREKVSDAAPAAPNARPLSPYHS
jgi:hypothetical protein